MPLVVDSVTLSEAKGLARGAPRCFAALSMTVLYFAAMLWQGESVPWVVTLSEAKGLARGAPRCFAALSMTVLELAATRRQSERVPHWAF